MTEPPMGSRDVVSFGPFSLAARERLLTRDGAEIGLSSRALDLLIRLVAHPNEPLGKRELLAGVWPDQTVGEASLRFHMANLRKALGDGQDGARYIATLSGRGYCFVAPVSHAAPAEATTTGNLPPRPPLIGRDEDLAEVAELLGRERLVTIVGPGGVGKTRLAIAAGWRLAETFPAVWWVDLAPLSEPSLVISAVATALDLARGAPQISADLLVSALRDRRLLLILDNCEYLVDATAELAEALVEGIPGLTLLATSQESLRLDAERAYRLDPLKLPPPTTVEVAGYGAVELFTHRARAADRRFELSETNAADVAEICRSLDGMPLSLEMAAARVPSLGIEGLRASLEARLQVLSAGLRTSDVRHQTLRGMAEWSVGLLDETEALVFRRLGVFSGSFSLEAAMAVVASGKMDRWAVADAVGRLVDKSVVSLERGESPRYRLLETLRLYAREQLQADWDVLAERHARHFCQVFAPAREAWQTTPDPEWEAAYMPELDNLRSALDWSFADPARFDLAVELTASTGFIWWEWGLAEEGQRILTRVVEGLADHPPSVSTATILHDAGYVLRYSGRYDEAQGLFERSAAIFRTTGNELGLAKANVGRAAIKHLSGRPNSEAAELLEGVCETLSAYGQKRWLCAAMIGLGSLANREGRNAEAADHLSLAATLARQLKTARAERAAMSNLAQVESDLGNTERAIEIGWEIVRRTRLLPYPIFYMEIGLENLSNYLVDAERLNEARPVAAEALSLVRHRPGSVNLLRVLQLWARIATMEGQDADAGRLIGWIDAAYVRLALERNIWEAQHLEHLLSQLGSRLSEAELSDLAAEGARWDTDRAVSFTFDRIVRTGSEARVSS